VATRVCRVSRTSRREGHTGAEIIAYPAAEAAQIYLGVVAADDATLAQHAGALEERWTDAGG